MKIRFVAAALAAFFMLPMFGVAAYAGGGEPAADSEPQGIIDITPRTEAASGAVTVTDNTGEDLPGEELPSQDADETPNPFTPSGTGTVVDHATGGDGKEFYTIMTPAENVFYLIIDRQRTTENVYFLNAVTEADLLALAEAPPAPAPAEPSPAPTPAPSTPEPEPDPAPEKGGGAGMLLLVVLLVLVGGGAGYYFKIYRPKQQQADSGEDFGDEDYADDSDPYGGEQDAEPGYDSADWYGEGDEPEADRLPDGDGGE